jgi:hypothetical protein
MLSEAAQFEMSEFNDRCRNFGGKLLQASHQALDLDPASACQPPAATALPSKSVAANHIGGGAYRTHSLSSAMR